MKIIENVQEMQQLCLDARQNGERIAFVPTMGYLHEGHLSLVRAARQQGDRVVLSIFVNPAQFGVGEDFDRYPRDLSRDAQMAEAEGVDWIFAPRASDMYPQGYATFVAVEGLTETLCGRSRPGHFRGVTTVVAKLFAIVQPHAAYFGNKDFQQLAVIRRMTTDLNFPVDVRGLPIVREEDGLAMSSRNVNLSAEQRRQALSLSKSIELAQRLVREGENRCATLVDAIRSRIEQEPDAQIDYVQICDQDSLQDVETVDARSVLLLAVKIGDTRLIDNHHFASTFGAA